MLWTIGLQESWKISRIAYWPTAPQEEICTTNLDVHVIKQQKFKKSGNIHELPAYSHITYTTKMPHIT
jgi:hypothetical protein